MTTSPADLPARNDIELPPAVHWPTVYVMAGVGGGLVAALLAVGLIAAAQGPPAGQPAAPVAVVLPAPSPHPAARTAAHADAAPADSSPPEWKPLVPPPLPVTLLPAPEPRVVLASEPVAASEATPNSSHAPPPRNTSLSESELLADLQKNARPIDLNAVDGTSARLLTKFPDDRRKLLADLIARRPDLAGLPLRGEAECRPSADAAKYLGVVSLELRVAQVRADRLKDLRGDDPPPDGLSERDQKLVAALADLDSCTSDKFAPALAQMLCVESTPVRLQLTKILAAAEGPSASQALAQQALFDLKPEVREAAIKSLKDRPREEYRQALLDGFRYPWPPVADHAAAALTAVDDRQAAKALAKMLTLPDPSAPALDENKKWVKPELVKVNHLRNCLLCHAPSFQRGDPVRGLIPKPGEEIPLVYCDALKGDFVRADVTYLKQDFSVMESVPDCGRWPAMQRFDYLIRRRELTAHELRDGPSPGSTRWETYPQREAVRLALEKLTGKTPDAPPAVPGGPAP